jgi:uncharacterized protein YjdB
MPFTFKLSKRLARMKVRAVTTLVAGLTLAACEQLRDQLTGIVDPVAQVMISPDTITLDPSQSYQFRVLGRTMSGDTIAVSVRWAASAGTITAGGLFTPDGSVDDVIVTASLTSQPLSGSSRVRTRRVVRLVLNPANVTVRQGASQQFSAYGMRNSGDSVAVAVAYSATGGTITAGGLYTAGQTTGPYRVVALQSGGSLSDTSAVTVSTVPVASVTVSPASGTLTAGGTYQLAATPRDSLGNALSGRAVSWSSSAPAVATVSGSGLVTGVAAGGATITATSEGKSGTAAVTVTAAVGNPGRVTTLAVSAVTDTSVTLSFTEVGNGAGQPATYDVRYAAGAMDWGSAPTVTRGTCTTPLAGTAIGATRTCTVLGLSASTVYQFQMVAFRGTLDVDAVFGLLSNVASGTTAAGAVAPVATVTVSPVSASVAAGGFHQFTAVLKDAAGNTLTGRPVAWSTSNPAAATVSGTGLVSGIAVGSATITATSEGKSGSGSVTVTAPAPSPADTVFADGFEAGNLALWQDGPDVTRHRVVTDAAQAHSGSRVLEVTYPAGSDGGWLTRWFMPGYDSLYVSMWVRFPTTWQGGTKLVAFYGSRTDDQWSAFGQAGKCPNGTDFFSTMVVAEAGGSPGPTRFYSYYPAMQREADGVTCWGRFGDGSESYVPPLAMSTGSWHKVEFWVKLNTPGSANASQTFWIDGVQRGSWGGFSFRSSTILRLNAVQLTFSNSETTVQTQKLYIDDILVSTHKPGTPPPPPAPVATVSVSPASATIGVGGGQQFTATLRDAAGNILTGRTVTWASNAPLVASVSSNGMVSGLLAGTATITATSEGQNGSGGLTVSTTPPAGAWPNEPAGFTPYNDQPWNQLTGNGWQYLRRSSSQDASIMLDASAPRSPSNLLRIVYSAGCCADAEPSVHWLGLPNPREVYTAWWMKLSSNWIPNPAGGGKITFLWASPDGNGQVYTNLYHPCAFPETCSPEQQGAPYKIGANTEWAPYGQKIWYPNVTTTWVYPGEWHLIEFYYKTGTAGNGIIRWWVDGVLNGDHRNVTYPNANGFHQFEFGPTVQYAGPQDRYMYIDHVYVSTP